MATLERPGRAAIVEALPDQSADGRTRAVCDDRAGLVPRPPARVDEAPDEIDVLTDPQRRVEPADLVQRLAAHEDRGGRRVRDSGGRRDASLHRAEVEGAAARFVAGDRTAGRGRAGGRADDARRDQRHPLVVEVGQQRIEPARGRDAVGVDEREQRCRHAGRTGRASGCGAAGVVVTEQPRSGRHDGPDAAVVDHDDRGRRTEAGQRGRGIVVPHRDHHGHIRRAEPPAGRTWVRGAGVEQPVDER
jgi:hypothetical protein